jgi:hypothetical protein
VAIGDIIAGYAAVVGTAAAAWPIWQARQARRPQVEVVLFNTLLWRVMRRRECYSSKLETMVIILFVSLRQGSPMVI